VLKTFRLAGQGGTMIPYQGLTFVDKYKLLHQLALCWRQRCYAKASGQDWAPMLRAGCKDESHSIWGKRVNPRARSLIYAHHIVRAHLQNGRFIIVLQNLQLLGRWNSLNMEHMSISKDVKIKSIGKAINWTLIAWFWLIIFECHLDLAIVVEKLDL